MVAAPRGCTGHSKACFLLPEVGLLALLPGAATRKAGAATNRVYLGHIEGLLALLPEVDSIRSQSCDEHC